MRFISKTVKPSSWLLALLAMAVAATATGVPEPDGNAVTVKHTFSRETSVSISIHAEPKVIWALLTAAADYPRWNSTVLSIQGDIRLGEKIKLVSYLDPKRTFKLEIKEFQPEHRLVWGDGQGSRVFALADGGGGTVVFSMTEKIGGIMFPLYSGMIPPFDEAFHKFAADLKKEAESHEPK
jgi:uncharacterized protein YndB with AHSA1/START domain